MSNSYSPDQVYERDVKTALAQVMKLYPRGTRFQYEPVQPSAGTPARLWIMEDGGRTSFPGLDMGMLGWTRKEARRTLLGIVAGAEAQRLAQAETIRRAGNTLSAWHGTIWPTTDQPELLAKLNALAPPTEF